MTEWLHFHFSLSCIGEGNGNPLQGSCLENPRDGAAWWAAIYGVSQSRTRLKWLSRSSSSSSSNSSSSMTYLYRFSLAPSPIYWPDGCLQWTVLQEGETGCFLMISTHLYFLLWRRHCLSPLGQETHFRGRYYLCLSRVLAIRTLLWRVVQLLNHVRLCVTPWTTAHQAFPGISGSQYLSSICRTMRHSWKTVSP